MKKLHNSRATAAVAIAAAAALGTTLVLNTIAPSGMIFPRLLWGD
jgi:2-methylaconitate cis-trans-isomerase PrpF